MRVRVLLVVLMLWVGLSTSVSAQFKRDDSDPNGAQLGETQVQRWRVGLRITATSGSCRGIIGYTSVPVDWPEQKVKIVDEDIDSGVKVSYRMIDGQVKLMLVRIPILNAGAEAKAIVTFEIRRSSQVPPEDTAGYVLPDPKKLDRKLRMFLAPSPYIESRHAKIRKLAKQIGVEEETAWEMVEAIYDWVRDKVEYKKYKKIKGALAALNEGTGDCEELTSLFVALCRASNVPARSVWVPGHCYAEFYLQDAQQGGHWFPCQPAGAAAFGGIPEFRPILQKGDNIRAPYNRRGRQRYLSDHLTCSHVGGKPRVKFIRQRMAE